MLIKIMLVFLLVMALLAMFARSIMPKLRGPKLPEKRPIGGRSGSSELRTSVCPACGRPQIGSGPCPCGHGAEAAQTPAQRLAAAAERTKK